MDFSLTDEQEMLRDAVLRFVREDYSFERRRELAADPSGCNASVWAKFADLGWLGLSFADEVGGLGCSFVETALLMEAFGGALVFEPYASTVVLCGHLVQGSENAELKQRVLSPVIDGKLRLSLAHQELQSRYDLDNVAATARAEAGSYLLNGTKILSIGGANAHRFIVSVRLEEQLALFLVDASLPGVTVNPYRLLDDTNAADVTLQDVRVAAADMLFRSGLGALHEACDRYTLAKVAESLGAMESVLALTGEYAQSRVQFAQPIIKFQATQHRLAEMFVEVQETRSILFAGLAGIDAPAARRQRIVSAAKVVASNAGRVVGGLGIQLHGGIGVTEEYRVGHYLKRLITSEKLFGDLEFHLARMHHVEHAV